MNRCLNFCSVANCPTGTVCQGNKCVLSNACTSSQQCPPGRRCTNGQCIDTCAAVSCPVNSNCFNGNCIPNDGFCFTNSHCPSGA